MNLKANNPVEKRVLEYVLANASPDLMARIDAEGKTIQKCWAYVTSYARKHATNSQYCMTDEEAFGLVMHYFEDEPEGATYKTDEEKKREEEARLSAAEREAKRKAEEEEARRKEEERIAALTPEEREAELKAKAEAEAKRKLEEDLRREQEAEQKRKWEEKRKAKEAERAAKEQKKREREQAKAEAERRKAELADAQLTFTF